jgi:predicted ester cyclase
MSDTNKNLVRRHFEEIWNQRKMAACDELMADDFFEHAAAPFAVTAPGRVHGPSAMRGTAEWLLGQFPDLSMRIESIVADGDTVAVRVRSTGTNSGKLNGFLPPSGKRFTNEQSHWFRIEDGKLAEHWATRDDLSAMLQLGVVTPPRLGALLRQVRSAAPYWLRGRRAHSGSSPPPSSRR